MSMASLGSSLIVRKGQARPAPTTDPGLLPPVPEGEATQRVICFPSRPAPRKPVARTAARTALAKAGRARKRKTLRLQAGTDTELHALAARMDVSQQYIMETALREFLSRNRR